MPLRYSAGLATLCNAVFRFEIIARMKTCFLLIALLLGAAGAVAASQIVPAQPLPFATVSLRTVVDSCTFIPSTVRVTAAGDTLRVAQVMNQCFAPGTPMTVDIRLGSFPEGSYRVELYAGAESGTPIERLSFEVRGPVEPAVFPPATRPLANYGGLWYVPSESGWGISLTQGTGGFIFGTWYVYNANNQPEWYTFQNGAWTSFTTWTALVYRNSGPFLGAPTFDPRFVTIMPVGMVTFDFAIRPGLEGRAAFTYSVNGLSGTKTIERLF